MRTRTVQLLLGALALLAAGPLEHASGASYKHCQIVTCITSGVRPGTAHRRTRLTGPPRPHIVWKPIPFPAKRKAEMAAYSLAHYGTASWRLTDPHVIVEHYTASDSFSSAWYTFAADSPDPELHQLPGDCAHFVIDTDGTIYQLVPLTIRCRHTVGLNWTAIGIEHVGTSDASILDDPRQLDASLALTVWLMWRYRISLGDVIGHAESLTSPYHHELYVPWRCQTHGDWTQADMDRYRSMLASLARRYGVALGKRVDRVSSAC
jgi:beta-N-acetylhexosaminidase